MSILTILTVEVISAIVLAIVLYASISETTLHARKDRVFSAFVAVNLLILIMDALTWALDGNAGYVPALNVMVTADIAGAYPVAIMFGEYLKLYMEEHDVSVNGLQKTIRIIGAIFTILTVVACISGRIFFFDGGHYREGDLYSVYLITLIPLYVLQFIMAIRGAHVIGRHDMAAFIGYALIPVFTMVVNMFLPQLSLTYAGMAISILMLYVMLQNGQRHAAAVRERALLEKSYTDDVTGLKNRRAFMERTAGLAEGEKVGIVFSDVNGLKYINDTMGHAEGDALLQRISAQLVQEFENANVYRISGDEFVILLTGIGEGKLTERVEHLKTSLRRADYDPIAIGMAEGSGAEINTLMAHAEEAMYADKAIFHHKFPDYVRGGSLFIRDILDDANNEPDLLEDEDLLMQPQSTERQGILVVESGKEDRRLLNSLLGSDYHVVDAGGIDEALSILSVDPRAISIILLNVHEPEISGIEFMKRLSQHSAIAGIPVILTTKELRRDVEKTYLRMGVYDCIRRPYSPDMLLNSIRRTVNLREMQLALAEMEFDELTGVYTKQAFFHHARMLLTRERNKQFDLTVLDIIDFKNINSRNGEAKGDALLKHIGNCLREALSDINAKFGRYGSDVFVFLTESGSFGDEDREELSRRIEGDSPVNGVTVKYGFYQDVPADVAPTVLCDRVIAALSTVKHRYGVKVGVYDLRIQKKLYREHQLESDMERAIRENQFRVFYQPKHDAKTGKLVGAEALLRWEHPEFGFLAPDEFIPMFESSGFVVNADRFVWQRTCRNLRMWNDKGIACVPVSVNTSRLDYFTPDFITQLDSIRMGSGLSVSQLHIEITESAFADSQGKLMEAISAIRKKGYAIEMDDFGAGFSSLNTLATLPVDVVKLDKQFVRNASGERSMKVMAACINMAHELNISVLAEGVEMREELNMLRNLHCDTIQGYFYSRPLSENDFEIYLRKAGEF